MAHTELNSGVEAMTAHTLIDAYPAPALICAANGQVVHANQQAGILLMNGSGTSGTQVVDALASEVEEIASRGDARSWAIEIISKSDDISEIRTFKITGVPLAMAEQSEKTVGVLAWETTFEANLRSALIDSRTFFKELADFAGDFVWATDATGRFTYISRSGSTRFCASDLHGRLAEQVFHNSEASTASVFRATVRVDQQDVWIDGDGRRSCFRFSAEPVFDAHGHISGARGVGQDVTELKLKEAELARMRRLEAGVNRVLQAMRSKADPDAMLPAAAEAVAAATGISACLIFRRTNRQPFDVISADLFQAGSVAGGLRLGGTEAAIHDQIAAHIESNPRDPFEWECDDYCLIAVPAWYGGELFGVCCAVIDAGPDFDGGTDRRLEIDAARELVLRVRDQMAATIALVEKHKHLEELSHTDSLTGLVNRRAFYEEARRRLSYHKRHKRTAALLYIDLDNFKAVNDLNGHAMGDELLRFIAKVIQMNSRESDIAVRFGGDEFGLWMEGADQTVAELKAGDLIEQVREISPLLKDRANNAQSAGRSLKALEDVGMSIGIAVLEPDRSESLESLINRADAALYAAKDSGKRGYRIAPPLSKTTNKRKAHPNLRADRR